MREIKEPVGVDSLGKLTEWLAECGMPQQDRKLAIEETGPPAGGPRTEVKIEHEEWGHGFKFDPEVKDAANIGYRSLVRHVAQALYGRFSYADGKRIIWRVRPFLSEDFERVTTWRDGSAVDWMTYDGDDDYDDRLITVFTKNRVGVLRSRLAFVDES